MEFVADINVVFPQDTDLRTCKIFLEQLIKINPKSVIRCWKESVNDLYSKQILSGDLDYFINKDYNKDLDGTSSKGKMLNTIDTFRAKIKNMGDTNKQSSIKYVQNLTKLCNMYYQ